MQIYGYVRVNTEKQAREGVIRTRPHNRRSSTA